MSGEPLRQSRAAALTEAVGLWGSKGTNRGDDGAVSARPPARSDSASGSRTAPDQGRQGCCQLGHGHGSDKGGVAHLGTTNARAMGLGVRGGGGGIRRRRARSSRACSSRFPQRQIRRAAPPRSSGVPLFVGGGGGNRTRVRQRGTRTSPGAACYGLSQPRRSHRHVAEPGSVAVDVPAGPATGPLGSGLLADASYRVEGTPGLTDLRTRSGGEGEVGALEIGT